MRNKITLDAMEIGCCCKCIYSQSDGDNTMELYIWSAGLNPYVNMHWQDGEESGQGTFEECIILDTGEAYYSANPEIFTGNRVVYLKVCWDGDESQEMTFNCVNLQPDTNFTVTRIAENTFRVAAAEDDAIRIATKTNTGIVQIGDNINVDESGIITIPIASKEALGITKIGDGIDVAEGTISLAVATDETIGGMKPGNTVLFGSDGTIDVPLATSEFPGVVKVGDGLAIDEYGTLSANGTAPLTEYEYLTDLSVKYNGVTYTAEKDDTTGLISRIYDDSGNEFEPTINSGITDITMHNAVFWAVAMSKGLSEPQLPSEKSIYNHDIVGLSSEYSTSMAFSDSGSSIVIGDSSIDFNWLGNKALLLIDNGINYYSKLHIEAQALDAHTYTSFYTVAGTEYSIEDMESGLNNGGTAFANSSICVAKDNWVLYSTSTLTVSRQVREYDVSETIGKPLHIQIHNCDNTAKVFNIWLSN